MKNNRLSAARGIFRLVENRLKTCSHIKEAIGQAADISKLTIELLSFLLFFSKFEIPYYMDLMK